MPLPDPKTQPYANAAATPSRQQDIGQINKNLELDGVDMSESDRQFNNLIAGDKRPFVAPENSPVEQKLQNSRLKRDTGNSGAAFAEERGLGKKPGEDFYGLGQELRADKHDPNVGAGEAPGYQEALQTASDYAHKTQGFTDPEYLNGKAQDTLMQLHKEGIDLKSANPQLVHMYVTGDKLSQAYALMRLSGTMDESGAMRRMPGVHTQGLK